MCLNTLLPQSSLSPFTHCEAILDPGRSLNLLNFGAITQSTLVNVLIKKKDLCIIMSQFILYIAKVV